MTERRYWLFKSEPSSYSFSDLMSEEDQTAEWDGVRNYQARNFLRDEVKVGDRVLFYHSNVKPPAVVGTAVVVRDGYPDDTAWDPDSEHPRPEEHAGEAYLVYGGHQGRGGAGERGDAAGDQVDPGAPGDVAVQASQNLGPPRDQSRVGPDTGDGPTLRAAGKRLRGQRANRLCGSSQCTNLVSQKLPRERGGASP